MGKLQEYELRKLGQQVVDFHDDVRDLVNNGKVAFTIVSAVPTWTADNGELAVFLSNGTSRIYARISSSWTLIAESGGSSLIPPSTTVFERIVTIDTTLNANAGPTSVDTGTLPTDTNNYQFSFERCNVIANDGGGTIDLRIRLNGTSNTTNRIYTSGALAALATDNLIGNIFFTRTYSVSSTAALIIDSKAIRGTTDASKVVAIGVGSTTINRVGIDLIGFSGTSVHDQCSLRFSVYKAVTA